MQKTNTTCCTPERRTSGQSCNLPSSRHNNQGIIFLMPLAIHTPHQMSFSAQCDVRFVCLVNVSMVLWWTNTWLGDLRWAGFASARFWWLSWKRIGLTPWVCNFSPRTRAFPAVVVVTERTRCVFMPRHSLCHHRLHHDRLILRFVR